MEHAFETAVEAINAMVKAGFTENLKAENGMIRISDGSKAYEPALVEICHQFRFEGMTNPSDSSVLMALKAPDGTKGTLLMSYSSQHSQDVEAIRRIGTAIK